MTEPPSDRSAGMQHTDAEAFYALIRLVRRVFNGLSGLSDAIHADRGVTAGMRAVMEQLALGGPRTVPDMARARSVSRQHIQVLVNALVDRGIAENRPNPAHRRSVKIALTPAGDSLFDEMQADEIALLDKLAGGLSARQIEAAHRALAKLDTTVASAHTDVEAGGKGRP